MDVEEDEAGKLAAFRAKFGTAWDADQGKGTAKVDHFMDLLSGNDGKADAAKTAKTAKTAGSVAPTPAAKAPAKSGKK